MVLLKNSRGVIICNRPKEILNITTHLLNTIKARRVLLYVKTRISFLSFSFPLSEWARSETIARAACPEEVRLDRAKALVKLLLIQAGKKDLTVQ